MEKIKSTKEIDKLTNELIENNILKHTIQFFTFKEKKYKPYGSGVLALIHDTHFILTCSHVADFFENNPKEELYIKVNENGFINVLGEIKYTEIKKSKNIDLAYIKIDEQMLPYLKVTYNFINTKQIKKHNKLLDAAHYCILGYPEKNIIKNEKGFETGASYFLTKPTNNNPYSFYKFDEKNFIILEMKGIGKDMRNGERKKVSDNFYGISGGGLWLLTYVQNPIKQEFFIDYKLVGIMTDFRKGKYYCLIANKIHILMEALTKIEGFQFKMKY